MDNETNGISRKIFSVDLAGDLKNAKDAYRMIRAPLSSVARANVALTRRSPGPTLGPADMGSNEIPKMYHVQVSIFERSTL